MNILVFVLAEDDKAEAVKYVNKQYPDSKLNLLLKKDLATKSVLENIAAFRKEKYDVALVFSSNLEYQTKTPFLKGVLLLTKAKSRKIVDACGGETEAHAIDFIIKSIPALAIEFILSILGLLLCFILLNVALFFLKLKKAKPGYKKTGDYLAYTQTTFVVKEFGGGEPSYWVGVSDALAASGYKTNFFVASKAQFKDIKSPVHLIKPGRLFDSLPDIHKLMYNFKFIRHAGRFFSGCKPMAIIQYHEPFEFSGVVLAALFKIPLLLDAHDITQWELSFWHKIHLTYFAGLIEEICFLSADVILVGSQELKERLKKKVTGKNIVVRPNGVNVELFKPQHRGEEIRNKYGIKAEVVVGYAGSFASTHGIDIMLGAIESISKETDKIHFLLIGEGDKYSYTKNFVEQRGLADRVTLTGNISCYQIPLYLDACDVLIAVYTHTDFYGTPTKIFEYMALEKAVVATSQGQTSKIIDNGEDGLLIKLAEAKAVEDSLIKAILLLADDKDLRIKMGKKARQKVLENYTWKKTGEKIIKAYQEVTIT